MSSQRPLDGLRVLELGQLVAGPFAASLLGYFGAEVIKVEAPEGDPLRSWRVLEEGTSLWWRSLARNKKSIAINLRDEEGRELLRKLLGKVDVVVENFRPGRLEAWGLDPESLRRDYPQLVIVRVSGFGQTGPNREKPGYAAICEAYSGLRHLTGVPGQEPVRANLSLGDSLAGLHGCLGALLALYHRDRKDRPGQGQIVDVAITESILNVLESVLIDYERGGVVRQPSGSSISGVVPTGTYPCADGSSVVIGANGEAVFGRLCAAMGLEEMATDPRFQGNANRVRHRELIDARIGGFTSGLTLVEALERLEAHAVPCAPINDVAALCGDPAFIERGLFDESGDGWRLPSYSPRLQETPGSSEWAGPELGAHTEQVMDELLGLSATELTELRERGTIA